jgi:hypothetical protein
MDDLIGELGGKSDNDYHWGDGWVAESDACCRTLKMGMTRVQKKSR